MEGNIYGELAQIMQGKTEATTPVRIGTIASVLPLVISFGELLADQDDLKPSLSIANAIKNDELKKGDNVVALKNDSVFIILDKVV